MHMHMHMHVHMHMHMRMHMRMRRHTAPCVQIVEVAAAATPREGGEPPPPLAHVVYVRLASRAWTLAEADRKAAIGGTVERVLERAAADGGADNADMASDQSGGIYVNHGATRLHQRRPTAAVPRGSVPVRALAEAAAEPSRSHVQRIQAFRRLVVTDDDDDDEMEEEVEEEEEEEEEEEAPMERRRREQILANEEKLRRIGFVPERVVRAQARCRCDAPYRHVNGRLPAVQRLCEANARVMGAAARVLHEYLPDVYEAMWAPVRAASAIAPTCIYPTPAQQRGEAVHEWDVRDRLPDPTNNAEAALPTGAYV